MISQIFIAAFALIAIAESAVLPPKILNSIPSNSNGRIVGGYPTSIENHPWQAAVQIIGMFVCGGSIISRDTILTAAHCVYEVPTGFLQIKVGSNESMHGGVALSVDSFVVHEDYHRNIFDIPINDVAVLKLSELIKFNKAAQSIPLFDQGDKIPDGTIGTITGWGVLSEGGRSPSTLYAVDLPVLSKAKCDDAYIANGGIPDGQICAAYPEGGKDSCQGDSGGPLVVNGRQAGIISWGNGCAKKGWPGVYTEIASFRDWIVENAGI